MNPEAASQAPAVHAASVGGPLARFSASNPPPPTIPDHELLRRIGGGSYGDVWLARNVMGTLRAVKIVHRSTFDHERPYEREYAGIQKFEPVSRSHEGFVDILQIGRNDAAGCFYYVMELADSAEGERIDGVMDSWIDGRKPAVHQSTNPPIHHPATYAPQTLRSAIAQRGRLPVNDCVALGLSLARALAHLHAQGLVHRDIKPSNIIFVGGVPKLADIGLVTGAGEARSYVGTEGFIPPEGPGTPAADLFSLGKVLYEASTGKDRQDFPDPLTNLGDQPDKDRLLELNAVIRRACHPDARARYQSAEEMAAELEMLQRGESVRRARAKRQRRVLGKRIAVASVLVGVTAVAGWSFLQQHSAEKHRRRQEAQVFVREGRENARRGTKESLGRAIELFNRAIAIDPDYAEPHVGLGQAYFECSDWHLPSKQTMSEARKAALRAVELDRRSPTAHIALAGVRLFLDWDSQAAESEYRRALELNPNDSGPRNGLAACFRATGRLEEAHVEQARAYSLGPRNAYVLAGVFSQFYRERNYDKALEYSRKWLESDTNSGGAHVALGLACQQKGWHEQAIAGFQKARQLDDGPDVMGELGYAFAVAGKTNQALTLLRELWTASSNRYVSSYFVAYIHAGLGQKAEALECLHRAYEDRSISLVSAFWRGLAADPHWDGLRAEPQFIALLEKMGPEK